MWSLLATAIEFPPYLHNVHDVKIKTNGLIVGLPHIFGFAMCIGFAIFLDRMIKTEVMSVTGARRLATVIGHLFSAMFILILAYFGSGNIYVAVAMIVISSVLFGVGTIGCLANGMDISPNNSGTIMSIGRMVNVLTGFICPVIIKYYTAEDPLNFIPVLNITSIINIISGLGFCILGSGEVQHWDKPGNKENVEENNELMYEKNKKNVNT
ncbi:Na[+]-dependent inorganic phosphate cotransporter [Carabus blaptoides fortunei]